MRTMRSNLLNGAILGFSLLAVLATPAAAASDGDAASNEVVCCKKGDTTPPTELVKQVPPGGIHNPYDWKKLAKEDPDLVKQFRLPGCNECHGGTGGGGMCPALTQGVWFWGNTDDIIFRLVTLGSAELEKEGFTRLPVWHRPRSDAADGNDHQDCGPAFQDHCFHSLDQSS